MTEFSKSELLTTNRKALSVNLDDSKYCTFAEIGDGPQFFPSRRGRQNDRKNHFGVRYDL